MAGIALERELGLWSMDPLEVLGLVDLEAEVRDDARIASSSMSIILPAPTSSRVPNSSISTR